MKQDYSRYLKKALQYIHEKYGFLFERGYEVFSLDDYDLGWEAVLRKGDLFLKIIRSRGEEEAYFRSGTQPSDEFTEIGTVIYAAAGDAIPRWESSDIQVIERYLDRIEAYFLGGYVENKDSLQAAREGYIAAAPQGEVVLPPEPQGKPNIPVLYYPLMAIVIVLILGALATLFMVLIDRLF